MAIQEKPEPFNVGNPHPGYGNDKNIANEFGHTYYPKYVQTANGAKIAEDADEEAALLEEFGAPVKVEVEKVVEKHSGKKPAGGWPK